MDTFNPVGQYRFFGAPLPEMTGIYKARNPILVYALRLFDLVGRLHSRRHGDLPTNRPLRVLVANWGHLGDVVTILPLLEFLKSHPRVAKLGVLVGSWSKPVVEGIKDIDRVHVLDHWLMTRAKESRVRKFAAYRRRRRQVISEIMGEGYDLSVDLFATFPSTHRVMWQARIPARTGFASSGLGPYLTHPQQWDQKDEYILTKQLKLLDGLIGNLPPALAPVYPDFHQAPSAVARLDGIDQFLVMHLGPGDIKAWVFERWVALGHALRERGWSLVLTGARGAEAENARVLADRLPVLNLAGALSWLEFATVISKAAAVISVDTVTGHLAACFDVPAIVLMTGRTCSQLWRPNRPNVRALMHRVACAPCHRSKGCEAMACVRMISVEDVLSSLDDLLPPAVGRTASAART
jgi:ADP-heptose:LPS heptosyltransferase